MENFFNWLTKPIPSDEVEIWFNINNMSYEKIELYGDISKSLTKIVIGTYLGDNISETKISLSGVGTSWFKILKKKIFI